MATGIDFVKKRFSQLTPETATRVFSGTEFTKGGETVGRGGVFSSGGFGGSGRTRFSPQQLEAIDIKRRKAREEEVRLMTIAQQEAAVARVQTIIQDKNKVAETSFAEAEAKAADARRLKTRIDTLGEQIQVDITTNLNVRARQRTVQRNELIGKFNSLVGEAKAAQSKGISAQGKAQKLFDTFALQADIRGASPGLIASVKIEDRPLPFGVEIISKETVSAQTLPKSLGQRFETDAQGTRLVPGQLAAVREPGPFDAVQEVIDLPQAERQQITRDFFEETFSPDAPSLGGEFQKKGPGIKQAFTNLGVPIETTRKHEVTLPGGKSVKFSDPSEKQGRFLTERALPLVGAIFEGAGLAGQTVLEPGVSQVPTKGETVKLSTLASKGPLLVPLKIVEAVSPTVAKKARETLGLPTGPVSAIELFPGREVTQASLRGAAGIAGQFALVPAVTKAPAAISVGLKKFAFAKQLKTSFIVSDKFALVQKGKPTTIDVSGKFKTEVVGKGLKARAAKALGFEKTGKEITISTKLQDVFKPSTRPTDVFSQQASGKLRLERFGLDDFSIRATKKGTVTTLETAKAGSKKFFPVEQFDKAGELAFFQQQTALPTKALPKLAGKQLDPFIRVSGFKGATGSTIGGKTTVRGLQQIGFTDETARIFASSRLALTPHGKVAVSAVKSQARVGGFFTDVGKSTPFKGQIQQFVGGRQFGGKGGFDFIGKGVIGGKKTFFDVGTGLSKQRIFLPTSKVSIIKFADTPKLFGKAGGKISAGGLTAVKSRGASVTLAQFAENVKLQNEFSQLIASSVASASAPATKTTTATTAFLSGAGKATTITTAKLKSATLPGISKAGTIQLTKIAKSTTQPLTISGLRTSQLQFPTVRQAQKTRVGTKTKLRTGTRTAQKLGIGSILQPGLASTTLVAQKVKPAQKIRLDTGTQAAQKLSIGSISSVGLRTQLLVGTRTAQKTRLKFPEITPLPVPPTIPPGGLLFVPKLGKLKGKRRKAPSFADAFVLEVRRNKKFVPAFGGKAFTEKSAKSLAQQLVGGKPLASFRLKPVKGRRPIKISTGIAFKPEQFRKPIKAGKTVFDSKTFIEKTKFRIDEPGEFEGITLKGLFALKKKRKGKKAKKKTKKKGRK